MLYMDLLVHFLSTALLIVSVMKALLLGTLKKEPLFLKQSSLEAESKQESFVPG